MRSKLSRSGANPRLQPSIVRSSSRPPRGRTPAGLYYSRGFLSSEERTGLLDWLSTLHPIWERRYSTRRALPAGEEQRWLLRPVYWLGNWQFACLDYYHPPKGVMNRCVRAEPYCEPLASIVARIEEKVRSLYSGPDLPPKWKANTCLINFYGTRLEDGRRHDVARVGEHRDYEPGPVASLSLGERALFQFVESRRRGTREGVEFQQWLEEGALQIFGGPRWKSQLFHRVQRVERNKSPTRFKLHVENFETRRINFTFRYVPEEHIVRYRDLPTAAAADVEEYMRELARHSAFFESELGARS